MSQTLGASHMVAAVVSGAAVAFIPLFVWRAQQARDQNAPLQARVEELKTAVAEFEARTGVLQDEKNEAMRTVAKAEGDLESANRQIVELTQANAAAPDLPAGTVAFKEQYVEEYQQVCKTLGGTGLEQAKSLFDAKMAAFDELERQNQEYAGRVKNLTTKNEDLQRRIAEMRRDDERQKQQPPANGRPSPPQLAQRPEVAIGGACATVTGPPPMPVLAPGERLLTIEDRLISVSPACSP